MCSLDRGGKHANITWEISVFHRKGKVNAVTGKGMEQVGWGREVIA